MSAPILNIGPKSAQWLREVGVYTTADIERIGVLDVFRLLVERGINPAVVMLYALEGAITNTHWNEIGDERKAALRKEGQRIKKLYCKKK
ncbi:MAG: TfoX/Sxy family protein [Bacteroidetes bacterium]|nr:TfoX/Sxy family protein [Bacteroidota bacterium]